MKAEDFALRVKAHFNTLVVSVISDAFAFLEYYFEKIRVGIIPERHCISSHSSRRISI